MGAKEGLSLSCLEQGWTPVSLSVHSAECQPMPSFSTRTSLRLHGLSTLTPDSWFLIPESLFCETTSLLPLACPWTDSWVSASSTPSVLPSQLGFLHVHFLSGNLGQSSSTVVSFSPCRLMCLFKSFYFSGLLSGIRDNHLCSVPQF